MAINEIQNAGMEARRPFAAELNRVFTKAKITRKDYAALGAEIAKAQTPPRYIPYHYQTIQGWTEGKLLPTDLAMSALGKALAARSSDPALGEKVSRYFTDGTITELLEAAQERETELGYKPTELTHGMLIVKEECTESFRNLASAVSKRAEGSPDFYKTYTAAALSMVLKGRMGSNPSKALTYAMQSVQEEFIKHHPERAEDLPCITALHEQALRERGDTAWLAAEAAEDLGGMIRAIRIRRGESMSQFRKHLAPYNDESEARQGAAVYHWENSSKIPTAPSGAQGTGHKTLCEDIVSMAKTLDHAPNRLSLSIAEPWFDADKEASFRRVFSARIADHAREFAPVSRDASGPPDMREASPLHKVSDASLARVIVEGVPRSHE